MLGGEMEKETDPWKQRHAGAGGEDVEAGVVHSARRCWEDLDSIPPVMYPVSSMSFEGLETKDVYLL